MSQDITIFYDDFIKSATFSHNDSIDTYSGGEIPYNGREWNGKCCAYYVNEGRTYFTDTNGNTCCELGHLGNQATSNGH